MSGVIILDEPFDEFEYDNFNTAEYSKQVFGMYSGELVNARLAFDESLVSVVMDHFGSDTALIDFGDRFYINVEVSESPVFLGWMFQLGDKAEILAPESLRNAMRNWLNNTLEKYTVK